MSLSVLSLSLAFILAPSGVGQMSQKDWNAYRQVSPSIASILRGREAIGTAALVDGSGLFLAPLNSIGAKRVSARLSDGRIVTMFLKASDEPTKIALLQADDWIKTAKPFAIAEGLKSGDALMAVLPSGLIKAEFVGRKSGLVAQSRQLMPLSEISFEASAEKIGGGLVMTPSGNLVGFLNANLPSNSEADIQVKPLQVEGVHAGGVGGGGGGSAAIAPSKLATPEADAQFAIRPKAMAQGPADMTVAYTPSPRMLRQTLQSLMKGKDMARPSIGVDVKNAQNQSGALIQRVEPGSAADQAGLKAGDIVIEIEGQAIADQVGLATVIMDQEIGNTIIVKIKRGQSLMIFPVVVGSKTAKNRLNPGAST